LLGATEVKTVVMTGLVTVLTDKTADPAKGMQARTDARRPLKKRRNFIEADRKAVRELTAQIGPPALQPPGRLLKINHIPK
jgi:hypothetical protein